MHARFAPDFLDCISGAYVEALLSRDEQIRVKHLRSAILQSGPRLLVDVLLQHEVKDRTRSQAAPDPLLLSGANLSYDAVLSSILRTIATDAERSGRRLSSFDFVNAIAAIAHEELQVSGEQLAKLSDTLNEHQANFDEGSQPLHVTHEGSHYREQAWQWQHRADMAKQMNKPASLCTAVGLKIFYEFLAQSI